MNYKEEKEPVNTKKLSYRKMQSHLMQIYLSLLTNPEKILEIGIGNGFVASNLKRFCAVITADIDEKNNPDIIINIANIDDFSQFKNDSFDLIILCEVLEHVPYETIDDIFKSLKRITKKYILTSVPNQNRCLRLSIFKFGFKRSLFSPFLFIINIFIRLINKIFYFLSKLNYNINRKKIQFRFNGQHYWELGVDQYSEELFRKKIQKYFSIVKEGRLKENLYHHFFLLKK